VAARAPAVDLVGHSFGGWLVSKVAAATPSLVRRVVLLAPGGLGRYRANSSAAGLTGRKANMRILAERMPVPVAFAAASIFNIIARSPFVVHMVKSLDHGDYYRAGVVVPHPTLLVWGTEDDVHRAWAHPCKETAHRTATLADAERIMLADLPQGKGVWVEGASHALVIDALATVADLVSTWLGCCDDPIADSPTRAPPIQAGVAAIQLLSRMLGSTKPTAPMTAAQHAIPARL